MIRDAIGDNDENYWNRWTGEKECVKKSYQAWFIIFNIVCET